MPQIINKTHGAVSIFSTLENNIYIYSWYLRPVGHLLTYQDVLAAFKALILLSADVLLWLSVWSEVQIVCIWSSWCHCHPQTPLSLVSFKSGVGLPRLFWKRGRCSSSSVSTFWKLTSFGSVVNRPALLCCFCYFGATWKTSVTALIAGAGCATPGHVTATITLYLVDIQPQILVGRCWSGILHAGNSWCKCFRLPLRGVPRLALQWYLTDSSYLGCSRDVYWNFLVCNRSF